MVQLPKLETLQFVSRLISRVVGCIKGEVRFRAKEGKGVTGANKLSPLDDPFVGVKVKSRKLKVKVKK